MKKIVFFVLFFCMNVFCMQNNTLISRCNHQATIELCNDNVQSVDIFDNSSWTTRINKSRDGFCYSLFLEKTKEEFVISFDISRSSKRVLQELFKNHNNIYRVVGDDKHIYYCRINYHSWRPRCAIYSNEQLIEKLERERDGDNHLLQKNNNNFEFQKIFFLVCVSIMVAYYCNALC